MGRSKKNWGNWIAFAALVVSLGHVGVNIRNHIMGPQFDFLGMEGRVVEMRCHTSSLSNCWRHDKKNVDDKGVPREPRGRLTIVLPIFFTNTGAVGYNVIVDRVTAKVSYDGLDKPLDMLAMSIWKLVHGGGTSSTNLPFVPFLVEGGKANGAELRFAPINEDSFVNWDMFVQQIINGEITALRIEAEAHIVGTDRTEKRSCIAKIESRHRDTLEHRRDNYVSRGYYLSTTCSN
jgi:hypothetical protein